VGVGSGTLCSDHMKFADYLDILGNRVHQSMDFYFTDGSGIFQDDNVRTHRTHVVQSWFSEHEGSFHHMVWPPKSPDLNPVENLWDELEMKLRGLSPLPSTLDDLSQKLFNQWTELRVCTM
jgi:transposase